MEVENQSIPCNMCNGDSSHMLKDMKLHNQESRGLKDIYVGNSPETKERLGLHSAIKSADMKASSLSLLDGEYCGLTKQLSIEYVDILEILRAELSAAEAREFELIENELLSHDKNKVDSKNVDDRGKECPLINVAGLNIHGDLDSTKNFVFKDEGTSLGSSALAPGDSQNNLGPESGHCRPKAQLPDYQSPQMEAHSFGKSREEALNSNADDSIEAEGTLSVKREENFGRSRDGDGGPQNAESKLHGDSRAGCLHNDDVGILQISEVTSKAGLETVSMKDRDDAEEAGQDPSSDVLIVEVIGDAYPRVSNDGGAGSENSDLLDLGSSEDENEHLQTDECSEYSQDNENASIPFSGPISFSGVLSYSGMLSIPYSGSLSLHSESSTSTKSFAFPILPSDWTSSPAKIGPPDSRYLRRRRRWRPCFCCRRPTTLFD